jgi:hypothetical protein
MFLLGRNRFPTKQEMLESVQQAQRETPTKIVFHDIGFMYDESAASFMSDFLLPSVKEIRFWNVNMPKPMMGMFFNNLCKHPLQSLDISPTQGLTYIYEMLKKPHLVELQLHTQCNDLSAVKIAQSIVFLQTLKLSNNSIGDKGALAFARILLSNTSLTNLSLGDHITSLGTQKLAESLTQNTTLKKLCLKSNPKIGAKGVRALLDMMHRNHTLKYLSFWEKKKNFQRDMRRFQKVLVGNWAMELISTNNFNIFHFSSKRYEKMMLFFFFS